MTKEAAEKMVCPKCGQEKPLADYYVVKGVVKKPCKRCTLDGQKASLLKRREKQAANAQGKRIKNTPGRKTKPARPAPPQRAAATPQPAVSPAPLLRTCRVCGCTDDDCRQCIEAQGEPCFWVEEDLCSRCAPIVGQMAVSASAVLESREFFSRARQFPGDASVIEIVHSLLGPELFAAVASKAAAQERTVDGQVRYMLRQAVTQP